MDDTTLKINKNRIDLVILYYQIGQLKSIYFNSTLGGGHKTFGHPACTRLDVADIRKQQNSVIYEPSFIDDNPIKLLLFFVSMSVNLSGT